MDQEPENKTAMTKRAYIRGMFAGLGVAAVIMTGALAGWRLARGEASGYVLSDGTRLQKLEFLESLIDTYYLEEKDSDQLAEGIYKGLVYGLGDPYSCYYTAEEYQQEASSNSGTYVGIGIIMNKPVGEYIRVEDIYEGSPAQEAGMQISDEIRRINGVDVRTMSDTEAVDAIKNSGEEVGLIIYRESSDQILKLNIAVRNVELQSVGSVLLADQTGYLQISEFTDATPEQFRKAMEELYDQGMERLVVDLRNNPGGMLKAVCEVLRQMLPEGLIVYTEDKYGNRQEEFCEGGKDLKIPLSVIVNGGSASSAEIFAGAVQDYGLGPIVGETTFGKGIVQSIQELTDGSAICLTTASYYTPKGNNIHGTGISPDIPVAVDSSDTQDAQLVAAIRAAGGDVEKIIAAEEAAADEAAKKIEEGGDQDGKQKQ